MVRNESAAQQLSPRMNKKQGVGHEITLPETPRLTAHPVQPLEAIALHPERRSVNSARVIIKGCTDPDHHGLDPSTMFRHPLLLLRASQADPHRACAGSVDGLNHGGIFFDRQLAKGR
ncbi:hypothetical protein D9M70_599010 [compost metagenome]